MGAEGADRVERVNIDDLIPHERNSRTHDEEQVAHLVESIREFGFTSPVLINEKNVILAGHGRVMAARSAGMTKVPCLRVLGLTEAQQRAYVIADNKLALDAGWDEELLKAELEFLESEAFDLESLGLDDFEWTESADPVEIVEDEVPEPPAEPITKPGDLWILGEHRLLCGDSTKEKDVQRLMNGDSCDLCFTSPPYALGRSVCLSGNARMSATLNPYGQHDDNASEWPELMQQWFSVSRIAVTEAWVINVQPLAGNKRPLLRFVAEHSERLVDIATWDKGHSTPSMASGVMSSRYEWFVIFGRDDGASRRVPLSSWRGTVESVYCAPPQRNNEFAGIHAATMPIHVPTFVMRSLCDQSRSVYEPFCGTGTTLIAAEQLNRRCFGMEISPAYCDVIVKRWETLTGKRAVLEEAANG